MKQNAELSLATLNLLNSQEAEALFSELKAEGYPLLISKKQYASISGCSVSTVDNQIKAGLGLPNYKKMGTAKNSKIVFSLLDVANYFASQTIKTA